MAGDLRANTTHRTREKEYAGAHTVSAGRLERSDTPYADSAARANGKSWGGRKHGSYKVDPARVRELAAKGLGRGEIATALEVSRRTVSRMLAAV